MQSRNMLLMVALATQGLTWALLTSMMDGGVQLRRLTPVYAGGWVAVGVWWLVRRRLTVADAAVVVGIAVVGLVAAVARH